ncbi:MAG: TIGR01212 family radical SAM protein [Bacteroidales bacterium]|nr:TIGR01212 family radical SAM protein [Bacteroidales bacterium]
MLFRSFASYLRNKYGTRVQKISVNAGFTCPNRDGKKGLGGCIYCNNDSFTPSYVSERKSITQQIEEGINYFSRKYPTQKYIVYFQNYTNTYAPISILKEKYLEAINNDNVVGISIATRPDCISREVLELLSEINQQKEVFIEIGAETTNDYVLNFINRCHTYGDIVNACKLTAEYKLWVTLHLIIGLPYDNYFNVEERINVINNLPINCIKFHQLQIIEGTRLAELYKSNAIQINLLSLNEYIDLIIKYLSYLRNDIYLERFTSEIDSNKLIAPKWNRIKNYQITELIRKRMCQLGVYQGKNYRPEV